jgi:hypothetical protein
MLFDYLASFYVNTQVLFVQAAATGDLLHRLRDRLGHSSVLVTSRYLHT